MFLTSLVAFGLDDFVGAAVVPDISAGVAVGLDDFVGAAVVPDISAGIAVGLDNFVGAAVVPDELQLRRAAERFSRRKMIQTKRERDPATMRDRV